MVVLLLIILISQHSLNKSDKVREGISEVNQAIREEAAEDEVDEEESVDDNQSLGDMPRERQLTQKFLAGQLSFKDLMQVPAIIQGVFFTGPPSK